MCTLHSTSLCGSVQPTKCRLSQLQTTWSTMRAIKSNHSVWSTQHVRPINTSCSSGSRSYSTQLRNMVHLPIESRARMTMHCCGTSNSNCVKCQHQALHRCSLPLRECIRTYQNQRQSSVVPRDSKSRVEQPTISYLKVLHHTIQLKEDSKWISLPIRIYRYNYQIKWNLPGMLISIFQLSMAYYLENVYLLLKLCVQYL